MSGKHVVVIGGGLSSLAYVFYLRKFLKSFHQSGLVSKITLLEKSSHVGGRFKSQKYCDGVVHELEATCIRYSNLQGMNTVNLIEELGISDQIIPNEQHLANQSKLIYKDKRLMVIPNGFAWTLKKIPFSDKRFYKALIKENRTPKLEFNRFRDEDMPMHDFFAHRYGLEFAENLINPLARALYASDSKVLSIKSTLPHIVNLEQKFGSISRYLEGFNDVIRIDPRDVFFKKELLASNTNEDFMTNAIADFGLKEGLQLIIDKIFEAIINQENDECPVNVLCQAQASALRLNDDSTISRVETSSNGHSINLDADLIVAGIPAPELCNLIPDSLLSQRHIYKFYTNLNSIRHVPVINVCVEFRFSERDIPDLFKASYIGIHSESDCILNYVKFDSSVHDKDPTIRIFKLYTSVGGQWFNDIFGSPNESDIISSSLVDIILREIKERLAIHTHPFRISYNFMNPGIVNPKPGHQNAVKDIFKAVESSNIPLRLIGQSYFGIDVNDLIYQSRLAAFDSVKSLNF